MVDDMLSVVYSVLDIAYPNELKTTGEIFRKMFPALSKALKSQCFSLSELYLGYIPDTRETATGPSLETGLFQMFGYHCQ
jgi:hypothetical protein